VALMLRHSFGLEQAARAVEQAVAATIDDGCVTADIAMPGASSYSTENVGRAITAALLSREAGSGKGEAEAGRRH
jgi:3-isopropylmalate dehydrogenase